MAIQATDHQSKQKLHIKTAVLLQHVSLHHHTIFRETKQQGKVAYYGEVHYFTPGGAALCA
jgi:hypothetical protein